MEQNFKIGDVVYDVRFGKGVVSEIKKDFNYSIGVKFEDIYVTYTNKGLWHIKDANPSLRHYKYWDNEPQERVIEVWSECQERWLKRVLITFTKGCAMCWAKAETLEESKYFHCTILFKKWREIPTKVQLTKNDISEGKGVGVDPELIEIIN